MSAKPGADEGTIIFFLNESYMMLLSPAEAAAGLTLILLPFSARVVYSQWDRAVLRCAGGGCFRGRRRPPAGLRAWTHPRPCQRSARLRQGAARTPGGILRHAAHEQKALARASALTRTWRGGRQTHCQGTAGSCSRQSLPASSLGSQICCRSPSPVPPPDPPSSFPSVAPCTGGARGKAASGRAASDGAAGVPGGDSGELPAGLGKSDAAAAS